MSALSIKPPQLFGRKRLPTDHVALPVGVSAEEEVVVGRLGVDGRQLELLIGEHRVDSVTCWETRDGDKKGQFTLCAMES